MSSEQITNLIAYFESIGPQFDLVFATNVGTYYPASIKHLSEIFMILMNCKVLHENQTFLDAGSGDGRITALASLLGFESYGIELNNLIYESSVENITNLSEEKILTSKPSLICGDILDSSSYEILGKKFSEFQIIFNFNTLPYELTKKIELESQTNTVFIFNSIHEVLQIDNDLELVKKFVLKEINQLVHVYRKKIK